jgi:hypothetical protein
MSLPRGKVALNVAISLEARKLLAVMAIQKERKMAELVEEMIRMYSTTYLVDTKKNHHGSS